MAICLMLYLIDLIDFNKYMLIQNLMLAGSSLVSKVQRLSPLQSRMVRGSTLCVNTAHSLFESPR